MKTKEAVKKVLKDTGKSKYWLAKQLGVGPIMINHYIRPVLPCRMSVATAKKFTVLFDIEIEGAYNPIKEVDDEDKD